MRIGSSLFGVDLMAQHSLSRAFGRLNDSSTRLSTMLRINHGSDDPAGLIAVETLRAELAAINAGHRQRGSGRGDDPCGRFRHEPGHRSAERHPS